MKRDNEQAFPSHLLAVALLTILAAVLRYIQLTRFSFWADECLTVFVSQMPPARIFSLILLTDVHPPLYYFLLHFWQLISHNEIFLRSLSVLPGVAAVPVVYLLARRLISGRAAIVAAGLLAISPLHIVQSQQLRYPALLLLLTTVAALFFLKTLEENRKVPAAWFALFSALCLYINYISLGVLLLFGCWLALNYRTRPPGWTKALIALSVAGGLFLPWAPVLLLQAQRLPPGHLYPPGLLALYTLLDFSWGIGFWGMPRTGSRNTELVLLGLEGRPLLLAAGLAVPLFLLLIGLFRSGSERRLTFDKLFLLVVLGFGWLVCARSNVFQAKYVLPALPAFLLVVAAGLDRLLNRRKVLALLLGLGYLLLVGYGLGVFYAKEMIYQEPYREIARFLEKNRQPDDAVWTYHNIAYSCIDYYADQRLGQVLVAPRREADDQIDGEAFLEQMQKVERTSRRLWVVYLYEGHRDPGRFARDWFPVQFRKIPAQIPDRLEGFLELYEVVYRPAANEATPDPD